MIVEVDLMWNKFLKYVCNFGILSADPGQERVLINNLTQNHVE